MGPTLLHQRQISDTKQKGTSGLQVGQEPQQESYGRIINVQEERKKVRKILGMSAQEDVVSLANGSECDRDSGSGEGKAGRPPPFIRAQESARSSSRPGGSQEKFGFRVGTSLEEGMSKHRVKMLSLADVTDKTRNLPIFPQDNTPETCPLATASFLLYRQ